MRINLSNPHHTQQVSDLCEAFNCSPTQLLIKLIDKTHLELTAHAQLKDAGGKDDRQEITQSHSDK